MRELELSMEKYVPTDDTSDLEDEHTKIGAIGYRNNLAIKMLSKLVKEAEPDHFQLVMPIGSSTQIVNSNASCGKQP